MLTRIIKTLCVSSARSCASSLVASATAKLVDRHREVIDAVIIGDANALRAAIMADIADGQSLIAASYDAG